MMNKQEALKKIEKLEGLTIKDKDFNFDIEMIPKGEALKIVNQLDEPEKTVVPQFVAEWIEKTKKIYNLYGAMGHIKDNSAPSEIMKWFSTNPTLTGEILARAWLDGYEVEKEKLYTVELPNPNELGSGHIVLQKDKNNKVYIDWHYEDDWKLLKSLKLTESEIKQDFEWAWQFAEEVKE
ncbi:hypothetical protein Si049_01126 [Streptococcus infantarius subsp. infantarius]|nr:hypothetical protein [Streptococcus infantarius subsp. infantarius]